MENSKHWYQSTTIQAGVTMLVTGVFLAFDVETSNGEINTILAQGNSVYLGIIAILSSITSIYGRIKARTQIK